MSDLSVQNSRDRRVSTRDNIQSLAQRSFNAHIMIKDMQNQFFTSLSPELILEIGSYVHEDPLYSISIF